MEYYNKEMECMSLSDKKELQSKRLIDTVQKVYDNVKTYREKMDKIGLKPSDIKGIDDIHKLPFTTKQDLRTTIFWNVRHDKRDIIRVHASAALLAS